MHPRLLTVDDLDNPGWQSLLPTVHWLGDLYHEFKKNDVKRRKVTMEFGGDEDRPNGIHASELSGCMRKVVYSLMNTPKQNDAENVNVNMRMRFQQGHALHALTQDDFDQMCLRTDGLTFQPEVHINPDNNELAARYGIYSSSDGVFTFYDGAHSPIIRVGTEIKTASEKEYEKLKEPYPYHIEQTNLYMAALNLPLMWFFYYNKSNSNYTGPKAPFLTVFDRKLWARQEQKIQSAYQFAENRQLPDREEGPPCGWCPFSHTCKPVWLTRQKTNQQRRSAPRPGEFR